MNRLIIVITASLLIGICDLFALVYIAAAIGMAVGGISLGLSLVSGGATRPIGLAAPHLMKGLPKRPSDPNANIGCALFAAGLGSAAVTNVHYPFPFRVFYGVCIGLGIVISIIVAFRSRNAR